MKSETSAIVLENLSVSLAGRPVLEKVDLTVIFGSKTLISGQNGAGKTTLLKTMLGLVVPDSGRCVAYWSNGAASRHHGTEIAYLNQESIYVDFPISACEVVEIGVTSRKLNRAGRREAIKNAMALVNCGHLRRRSFSKLSGGEKQKVSLARCIAQNPRLLLLDEPCASLDPSSKSDILAILDDLCDRLGMTVLMVSHDEEAKYRAGWRHVHLEGRSLAKHGSGI
ncbi:MAG: metal ABC transporter ATP-binding protein [Spirochaetales bacterium]|nr:metal ABC transporter ATP-binding protein [Spirochaetales bacterium]